VDLQQGRLDAAADRFEHAFALGCQLSDPCWEGAAGRGLGLVAAARGDERGAVDILANTLERSGRLPDAYVWGRARILDAACTLAIQQSDARAPAWTDQLLATAARSGMRELLARAHSHRARLGVSGAAEAAQFLAHEIGNPRLDAVLR
jgi:mannose/cellobiose epimerase-like protein (N-acyl-D-glucosamine 2-epimerase family)